WSSPTPRSACCSRCTIRTRRLWSGRGSSSSSRGRGGSHGAEGGQVVGGTNRTVLRSRTRPPGSSATRSLAASDSVRRCGPVPSQWISTRSSSSASSYPAPSTRRRGLGGAFRQRRDHFEGGGVQGRAAGAEDEFRRGRFAQEPVDEHGRRLGVFAGGVERPVRRGRRG